MAAPKKTLKINRSLTPPVEEGPYYTLGSPERNNIAGPDTVGKKMIVTGRVLDIQGQPIAHAWLDFWHADGNGVYDNTAYNLRGHQYTDKDGRYHLETVRPKQYPSRAPHVHAKVRAGDSSSTLTTQLYFPGEKRNATDPIFEKLTVMDVVSTGDTETARFDFVVDME